MRRYGWLGIVALIGQGCASPPDLEDRVESGPRPGEIRVEFRVADEQRRDGWVETPTEQGETLYINPEPALTNVDIREATLLESPLDSAPQIEVSFTKEGRRRFATLTEENIAKRVAILIDNELVSAPIITQPIRGGHAVIAGDFSQERAREIVDSLSPGARVEGR